MMKIIFTGGGSAGHVTPNIALIKKFSQENWEINYIGSKNGIEKELIAPLNIPYYAIASGKLRRYFSWHNFLDPWKILWGIFQAYFLCLKLKPQIIFSKGGFVAFPVVVAAWLNRIPVIVHESDFSVGLANKLCFPFAKKICLTFPSTVKMFRSQKKLVVTGTPIREEFFVGSAKKGLELCGFTHGKKIILVFGGSLGAKKINQIVRNLLPELLINYQIAHVCGKGKIDTTINFPGYKQFEYLTDEFPHLMAAADLVISRAGANAIYELIALRKPNILLPLSKTSSRGDQILNAKYCAKNGYSQVIFAEDLTTESLLKKIHYVDQHTKEIINQLEKFVIPYSIQMVFTLVESLIKK
ncbi:MAG: undecaprenyldiphospho-muramoylpentapeptide beta-N-acetylglucosaminyltransferase [Gammaproteobacteria bacterium]|nr:undecaprenyldiphospho-muramoylpentapeptide beta-N-acetylglucosaminyltransferase [Gammaproteobacteria bacterium]